MLLLLLLVFLLFLSTLLYNWGLFGSYFSQVSAEQKEKRSERQHKHQLTHQACVRTTTPIPLMLTDARFGCTFALINTQPATTTCNYFPLIRFNYSSIFIIINLVRANFSYSFPQTNFIITIVIIIIIIIIIVLTTTASTTIIVIFNQLIIRLELIFSFSTREQLVVVVVC